VCFLQGPVRGLGAAAFCPHGRALCERRAGEAAGALPPQTFVRPIFRPFPAAGSFAGYFAGAVRQTAPGRFRAAASFAKSRVLDLIGTRLLLFYPHEEETT